MGLTVMVVGMAELFVIAGSLYIGMKAIQKVFSKVN